MPIHSDITAQRSTVHVTAGVNEEGLLKWPEFHQYNAGFNSDFTMVHFLKNRVSKAISIFSCDQAALRTVCLSVRPSVCYTLLTMFYHRIIMKFSGVITIDRHDVHAKDQGQRSKVKITEVKTPFSRFRTVTPVWIHICQWNDAQSLMLHRRGALLFFKVICQISRSHR